MGFYILVCPTNPQVILPQWTTTQQPKTLKGAAQDLHVWLPGGQCEQVMGESGLIFEPKVSFPTACFFIQAIKIIQALQRWVTTMANS